MIYATRMVALCVTAITLVVVPSAPPAAAGILDGIGLMGDSLTDEYQGTYPLTITGLGASVGNSGAGDVYPSNFYGATNVFYSGAKNWVELLAAHRGLNFGAQGNFGEPRTRAGGAGFEYDWARSGSFISNGNAFTNQNLLVQGQHTGLSTQVAAHQVTLAYLGVGSNDFGYVRGASMSTAIVNDMVTNFTTALETIGGTVAAPSGVPMVVGTALGGGNAFAPSYNDAIMAIAAQHHFPVIDINAMGNSIIAAGPLTLAGRTIEIGHSPISDPTNPLFFNLADNVHPGTVLNGLAANLFIRAVNLAYGTNLQPFSDQEILINAGITPAITGPASYYDISPFVTAPEPSTFALLAAGLAAVVVRRLPRRRP